MNGFGRDMVKAFLKSGKLEAVSEYAKIMHPSRKRKVILSSYKGSDVRVYTKDDSIHLMYPDDVSEIQMESVADAITKGTIFDDAESLDNHASYCMMKHTPCNAMMRHGMEPTHLKIVLTGVIGKMSDDGTLEISVTDMMNGKNFIDQLKSSSDDHDGDEVEKLTDHYLDTKDHFSLPNDLKDDIHEAKHELKDIKHLKDEKFGDEDFEKEDDDDDDKDDDEHVEQEGFFMKKPKKLKPIPRDIVGYASVEMNSIRDPNEQSMLAGYIGSKLELVDFYLTCIDTDDARYIVPHTRQYLTQMQNDLNNLLCQVLKIKPCNRITVIEKQNVTLPEGW